MGIWLSQHKHHLIRAPAPTVKEATAKAEQIKDLYAHLPDVPPDIDSTGEVAEKLKSINGLFRFGVLNVELWAKSDHRNTHEMCHKNCMDLADGLNKTADEIASLIGL